MRFLSTITNLLLLVFCVVTNQFLSMEERSLEMNLHDAVKSGNLELTKKLLDNGGDINAQDEYKSTPLHYATQNGNQILVELLVAKGADVKSRDKNGQQPIHFASLKGNRKMVSFLINHGAHIRARDNSWTEPIHYASVNSIEIVNFLLDKGADIRARNKAGSEPIHYAITINSAEKVKKLLDYDTSTPGNDAAEIHHIRSNYIDMVDFLLEEGANSRARDMFGAEPIHYASLQNFEAELHYPSLQNSIDMVQLLIDRGADIKALTNVGAQPMHYAAMGGSIQMLKFFLNNNISVNTPDNHGEQPLHYATNSGSNAVIEFLINQKADISKRGRYGSQPIHYASRWGYVQIVECFVKRDVAIDSRDNNGDTPLHYAIWYNHRELARWLIAHKADIHATNNEGVQPIHYASQLTTTDPIELLLNNGCNINATTYVGALPIHFAAIAGRKEMVEFLYSLGANIHAPSKVGIKPIDDAIKSGNQALIEWFLAHGSSLSREVLNTNFKPDHQLIKAVAYDDEKTAHELLAQCKAEDDKGLINRVLQLAIGQRKNTIVDYIFAYFSSCISAASLQLIAQYAGETGYSEAFKLTVTRAEHQSPVWQALLKKMLKDASRLGHCPIVEYIVSVFVNLEEEEWRASLAQALLQAALSSRDDIMKLILDRDIHSNHDRRLDIEKIGRHIKTLHDLRTTQTTDRNNYRTTLILLTRYIKARRVEKIFTHRFVTPIGISEGFPSEIANRIARFFTFPPHNHELRPQAPSTIGRCIMS